MSKKIISPSQIIFPSQIGNVTGAASTILGLTTIFFALGIASAGKSVLAKSIYNGLEKEFDNLKSKEYNKLSKDEKLSMKISFIRYMWDILKFDECLWGILELNDIG